MITSASLTSFDPRGVRYQAHITRTGGTWSIDVETVPPMTFCGPLAGAIEYAQLRLEGAVRSGAKPVLTGMEMAI